MRNGCWPVSAHTKNSFIPTTNSRNLLAKMHAYWKAMVLLHVCCGVVKMLVCVYAIRVKECCAPHTMKRKISMLKFQFLVARQFSFPAMPFHQILQTHRHTYILNWASDKAKSIHNTENENIFVPDIPYKLHKRVILVYANFLNCLQIFNIQPSIENYADTSSFSITQRCKRTLTHVRALYIRTIRHRHAMQKRDKDKNLYGFYFFRRIWIYPDAK